MTAPVVVPSDDGPLFASPIGLYPFQEDAVIRAYARPASLMVFDMGLGKTVLSMALSCLLFEDGLIDRVLVIAESGKVDDWANQDFPAFTKLSTGVYLGPRRSRLLGPDAPPVLVTTYETAAMDFVKIKPKTRRVVGDGPLLQFLSGQRVLVVYDEMSKLRVRTSRRYKAHDSALKKLRRRAETRVIGLTGTPIETGLDNAFNLTRLLDPEHMPTAEEFNRSYVADFDLYGAPIGWKNVSPVSCDVRVKPFTDLVGHLVLRKRKSDPDVRDQFPEKVEEPPQYVTLHERHMRLFTTVAALIDLDDDEQVDKCYALMRQLAGHPASILRSSGEMAKWIVREVGEEGIRATSSAKTEQMLEWALRLGTGQGVIFTFFGQSILPELADALTHGGYSVAVNHGGLTVTQKAAAIKSFTSGDRQIFLSSDAGCRGLNLGCGQALLHYEPAETHSVHSQRGDRIHRINTVHDSVTIQMLVARDTPDEGALALQISRQQIGEDVFDHDIAADDPRRQATTRAFARSYIAAMRKAMK